MGISVPSIRLVLSGGTGGLANSIGSCTVAARGIVVGTRIREIREPAEALGDMEVKMAGAESGIVTRNMIVARSIKGSYIPYTSSNNSEGKDMAGMFRKSTLTSEISNSPGTIKITWGQQRALGSTIMYTIASTR